ncbi:MAG: hypothetical protein WD114_01015 [Phycisphaerales bacterium]
MNDPTNIDSQGGEAPSNIFLNLNETDSTGIPSLKQAPVSAIASSAPESRFNTQLLVALCVVAVGAGVIYAMRYIGMRAGLDEKAVSIEYASEMDSADFSGRFATVMRNLDKSTIAVQLADHDDFVESPFSRPSAMTEEVVRADPGMSEEERLALQREREAALERERRRDLVIGEAMRFKLQGIVGGSRPAARVSGQAVRAGMPLGEFFTVVEITGRSVVIDGDGMRFELALGQETIRLDD